MSAFPNPGVEAKNTPFDSNLIMVPHQKALALGQSRYLQPPGYDPATSRNKNTMLGSSRATCPDQHIWKHFSPHAVSSWPPHPRRQVGCLQNNEMFFFKTLCTKILEIVSAKSHPSGIERIQFCSPDITRHGVWQQHSSGNNITVFLFSVFTSQYRFSQFLYVLMY